MANVRELITVLGFKVQEGPIKRFESRIGDLKRTLKQIAVATVAAGTSLFLLAKHTADLGDEIGETAKKIGISARSLQKLAFVARVSGVSQDQFVHKFRPFNKAIVEARKGSGDAAKAFAKLGITTKQLTSLKADELFIGVAEGFSKIKDPAEKSVLATKLFGRTGAALLPVFAEGAKGVVELANKFESLGGVMGDDFIKKADEFDIKWNTLTATFSIFRNRLGQKLLPVLEKVVDRFNNWIASLTPEQLKEFDEAAQSVADAVTIIAEAVIKLIGRLPAFIKDIGGARKILELLTKAFVVFFALKVAFNIAGIGLALVQMAAALKFVGFNGAAATAALTPLLGVLLAIGAAIAAFKFTSFVIEDVSKSLSGDTSSFGFRLRRGLEDNIAKANQFIFRKGIEIREFLKGVLGPELGTALWGALASGARELGSILFASLGGPAALVRKAWVDSWNAIKTAAVGMVNQVKASLAALASFKFVLPLFGPVGSLLGAAAGAAGAAGATVSPSGPGPTSMNTKNVNVTNNNNVNSSVTVNASTTSTPQEVADVVNQKVASFWNSKLRQAQQAVQGEVV